MEVKNGYSVAWFPAEAVGEARLCVVVGRGFRVDHTAGACVPEEEPLELPSVDELEEGSDPQAAEMLRPTAFEPMKLKADLLFRATAHAPGGTPVPTWEVRVQVGRWRKRLNILGPRRCTWSRPRGRGKAARPQPPVFSEPEPISELPIRYRYAYGGTSLWIPDDPEAYEEARKKGDALAASVAPPKEEAGAEEAGADIPEFSDEDWLREPDQAARSEREAAEARKITDAIGTGDVDLDDAHLGVHEGGTAVLDAETLARMEAEAEAKARAEAGGGQALRTDGMGRILDRDGTRVVDLADEGRERVAAEGWEKDYVRRDAEAEAAEEEESPWPRFPCPTNPVGRGFAACHHREVLDGIPLPQIEDPKGPLLPTDMPARLEKPGTILHPAGLGPIPRAWVPRALRAGLSEEQKEATKDQIDEMLLKMDPGDEDQRAAVLALADLELPDFDPRIYNSAPDDQQLDDLRGDERVRAEGVRPDGPIEFELPGKRPLVEVDRGRGSERVEVRLDTVLIDLEEDRVELFWRGRLPMSSLDDVADYPKVEVEVLDLDEEQWQRERALAASAAGGTRILDLDDLPPEESAPSTPESATAPRDDDLAWVEGVDQEVSPLLIDPDAIKGASSADDVQAALAMARAERRGKVQALKEQALALKAAEEKKKKKGGGKKK